MNIIRFVIYIFYNLVYQLFVLWCLLYANSFLNSIFIPDSFMWKDGHIREGGKAWIIAQTSILIIEAAIFIFLIYFINRGVLSNFINAKNPKKIAGLTLKISFSITLTSIIIFTYLVSTIQC